MMDYRQNPHVEIIRQCAAAVAAGLEPVVVQFYRDEWLTLATREDGMPEAGWNPEYKYRIKPRTVTVAGVELPEPLSEPDLRGIDAGPLSEWMDLVKRGYVSKDELLMMVKDAVRACTPYEQREKHNIKEQQP